MAVSVAISVNTNAYLNNNVLHAKPLSSRILHKVQHLNIKIAHLPIQKGWKKNSIKILSGSVVAATYLITLQIAVIELTASLALGLLGTLFQLIATKDNDRIEKYSIKTLAYGLHSMCTMSLAFASLITLGLSRNEWSIPKKHVYASMIDGTTYLGSAATAQLFCTYMFNSIRGAKDNAYILRSNQAIVEGTPIVFSDMAKSIDIDCENVGVENDCDPKNFARDYLAAYPPANHRDWITDFDFIDFISGHVLNPLNSLVDQYTNNNHFIDADNILERTNTEVVINPYNDVEKRYHDHLKHCVTEAVRRMIQEEWAKYLDIANSMEEGTEILAGFYSEATIPLANIAQFIELEERIICPREFNQEDLTRYNTRKHRLETEKGILDSLSDGDRDLLIERLIKTSLFELGARRYANREAVDHLFNSITDLSGELHQGKLLTLPTINVDTYEGGGENYFGKCWQQAIQEYVD